MVKIYDDEMREVHLPKDVHYHYGSYPLDLTVGSFEYETVGRKVVPISRPASLRGFIIAKDLIDLELRAEQVYAFFRQLGTFYVAKDSSPYKLLRVKADQTYTIGHGNGALVEYEVPLTVEAPYFKQSLHTTQELDTEGVRFNYKWAYGMGLSSEEEEWRYTFEHTPPRFLNAGTEAVKLIRQKDSEVRLEIASSAPWLEIDDGGTVFRLDRRVKSGDVLIITGSQILLNGSNALGNTNGQFLTVEEGWNVWRILNLSRFRFSINFRFLYD